MKPKKEKVIQLVKELRSRTGKSFAQITREFAFHDIQMTRDMFENSFRRNPDQNTNYYESEVVALIAIFSSTSLQAKSIHVFEALLLLSWTGCGFEAVHRLRSIFPEKLLKAALLLFTEEVASELDWFDPDQRQAVLSKLASGLHNGSWVTEDKLITYPVVVTTPSQSIDTTDLPDSELALQIASAKRAIWKGRLAEAERWLVAITSEEVAVENKTAYVEACQNLAILYTKKGQYDASNTLLQKGVSRVEEMSRLSGQLHANQGVNAFHQGDYLAAGRYFTHSLAIAQTLNELELIAFNQNGLGATTAESLDYPRARSHYKEALQLARRLGKPERTAFVLMNLGILNHYSNRYDAAYRFFEEAKPLVGQSENIELQVQCCWSEGALRVSQRDRYTAEAYLREALHTAYDCNLVWQQLSIQIELAKLYLQNRGWEDSLRYFEETFHQAIEIENDKLSTSAIYGLALTIGVRDTIVGVSDVESMASLLSRQLPSEMLEVFLAGEYSNRLFRKAEIEVGRSLGHLGDLSRYHVREALELLVSEY